MVVRRLGFIVMSLSLSALGIVASAAPATAHESLVSSSPADDERMTEGPSEVELVFTAEVLTLGAAVVVIDENGRDWVSGEPMIDGARVVAPISADLPEAGYQVRWRVVSGDGHPISSVIPFTVGDAEPFAADPGNGSVAETPGGPNDTAAGGASDESDRFSASVVRGLLGAAAAGGAYALVIYLRRRSTAGAGTNPPSGGTKVSATTKDENS